MKKITVVRFPNGSWSMGGKPNDPDYEQCEVYVAPFESDKKAKKIAQAARARLVKNGLSMPTARAPWTHQLIEMPECKSP